MGVDPNWIQPTNALFDPVGSQFNAQRLIALQNQNALAPIATQRAALDLQQASQDASDRMGARSLLGNPNADINDYARAGGLQGLGAYSAVQDAAMKQAQMQRLGQYYGLNAISNALDAARADPKNAAAILDSVRGHFTLIGASPDADLSQLSPDNIATLQAAIAPRIKSARDMLVPPEKQAQFENEYGIARLNRDSAERLAVFSARKEMERAQYVQGEETNRANVKNDLEYGSQNSGDAEESEKATANADLPAPQFRGKPSPQAEKYIAGVKKKNPDWSAGDFQNKTDARKYWTSGDGAATIRAFNTAIEHMDTLEELGKKLKNSNSPAYNEFANAFGVQTGKDAKTNFDAAKDILAGEIMKATIPGAGGEGEREAIKKRLDSSESTPQIVGGLGVLRRLLAGQLRTARSQYEATTKLHNFDSLISDRVKATIGNGKGSAANPLANVPTPSGNGADPMDKPSANGAPQLTGAHPADIEALLKKHGAQ